MISTKNFLTSALLLGVTLLIVGCEKPPIASQQTGFRGTGMVEMDNPRMKATLVKANALPESTPKADPSGPTAGSIYKNVQVLGSQSVGEFTRTMVAMTSWVSPKEGCTYCHVAGEDFAADTLHTKVVARKMLSMTAKINADWGTHVGNTGVTCYTCHRGNHIPTEVWYSAADPGTVKGFTGWKYGQNTPVSATGYSSLPLDSLSSYLSTDGQVRIQGPLGHRCEHCKHRVELQLDDAHVELAGCQLHVLSQQSRVLKLGGEHAAACHRLARSAYGSRREQQLHDAAGKCVPRLPQGSRDGGRCQSGLLNLPSGRKQTFAGREHAG